MRYRWMYVIAVVVSMHIPMLAGAEPLRLALIIGNGAYQKSPLDNPVNDAKDVAETLENLRFEVILKIDVDRRAMIAAIQDFGQRLKNGSVGVFYFSGHGIQSNNLNYLLPIKTNIKSEADVEFENVGADRILRQMEQANDKGINIIILDACRDNPYKSYMKGTESGLARMDSPTGSLIAYATAPGTVAYGDGRQRNSVYTKHLLDVLRQTPHLNITELFIHVRSQVIKETQQQQVPWESVSLTQMFRFMEPSTSSSLPAPTMVPTKEPQLKDIPERSSPENIITGPSPITLSYIPERFYLRNLMNWARSLHVIYKIVFSSLFLAILLLMRIVTLSSAWFPFIFAFIIFFPDLFISVWLWKLLNFFIIFDSDDGNVAKGFKAFSILLFMVVYVNTLRKRRRSRNTAEKHINRLTTTTNTIVNEPRNRQQSERQTEELLAIILHQYAPEQQEDLVRLIQQVGNVSEERARRLLKAPSLIRRDVTAQEASIAIEKFHHVGAQVKLITMEQLQELQNKKQGAQTPPPEATGLKFQMPEKAEADVRYALILRRFDPEWRKEVLEMLAVLSGTPVSQLQQSLKTPAVVLRDTSEEQAMTIVKTFQEVHADVKILTMDELEKLMSPIPKTEQEHEIKSNVIPFNRRRH